MSIIATYVDRGGTFTDVVHVHDDGPVEALKIPSDQAVVGELARGPLRFGTTVATNALLERRGVRVTLVVSEGFADLPWLRDQRRPELFRPDATGPAPLVARPDVIALPGRIGADGEVVSPLDLRPLMALTQGQLGSVAIALVNSHRNGDHERAVADQLRALGARHISLGHLISPELGYLARVDTTLVDAAITPVLHAALRRDKIPAAALAVRSDGSLCPPSELRAPDAVLSGPASGVLAVAEVARVAGFRRAVGLDMGGTSTDICRVDVGALPRREGDVEVAGVVVRRPVLEVETIAAGGGSILRSDGLRFTVGPESAGADPGPQCYGRGGPPTLTDAALSVGLLDPKHFPLPLDLAAVSLPGAAADFLHIAREAMAQAIRRLATARGIDVRDHALVAYGGAAGQHAMEVADKLGITDVLFHPCTSVLCAWGQSMALRQETAVRAIWRPLSEAHADLHAGLGRVAAELLDGLREQLPHNPAPAIAITVELRYQGTDHALTIGWSADDTLGGLASAFATEHRARYGFERPGGIVECKSLRVTLSAPRHRPPTGTGAAPWAMDPEDGVIEGPHLLSSPTTTIWIPRGWRATAMPSLGGILWVKRQAPGPVRGAGSHALEAQTTLWGNRFQSVASEAGTVLRRLARSVNIKERLDFSCAVFDAQGALVANAPHIPVHLGAMGETVRSLIASGRPLIPGQSWLCNDPQAGGSHLPDLTVTTVVESGGAPWFVACRGHHADVGGLTPGSMPPHSIRLADEGFVVRHEALTNSRGELLTLGSWVEQSRDKQTVIADLQAQIACNHHAARRLQALGPPSEISLWMARLHDTARASVRNIIGGLLDGRQAPSAHDWIDGVPLSMALSATANGGLRVDMSGTGGPHRGNLNAPPAVVRAALLYCLRVLAGRDIPLNEGCLADVHLQIPTPSILAPPPGAAVVGGNVETSQRLVDLFFAAAHARSASAGTMNNLTLGADTWSLYETIGGGLGATASHSGADGRQLHMTNTKATDVEVLEARLPVRVVRFALRKGSGGRGHRRGGDGIIRAIQVLEAANANLLAAWRPGGAPGMDGGGPGLPGEATIESDGAVRVWDGQSTSLKAGDILSIQTPGGGAWGEEPPGTQ